MRKFFVGVFLAGALLANVAAAIAAAPTNFSGTWVLDKSASQGLSPQLQNAESYTLTVTQDNQQLTTSTKFVPGNNQAGGPGGGGRGGMGMPSLTYKLDGTETTMEQSGGRPGSVTLKAVWKDNGKTLVLTTVRKFNVQGNDVTTTTTDQWSLSADGKTLIIQRTSESPRGTQSSTLVFKKQ